MDYKKEQAQWTNFVDQNIGETAILISVSVYSSDIRIYQANDTIFKVKRITPASNRGRLNSLEDEFLILDQISKISNIPNIPEPINYKRVEGWEMMEMSKLPPLHKHDPTFGNPKESLKNYFKIVNLVWQLNKTGFSHGDFNIHNVGINSEGSISLFDFDQASKGHPIQCWLRDFLGLGLLARPSDVSLFIRAYNVQLIGLLVKITLMMKVSVFWIINKLDSSHNRSISGTTPLQKRVALQGDGALNILAQAWSMAAISNASSPGQNTAYYSLDISGINFPGERPWLTRWYGIKECVNFDGKKLLELGSNLGLLSIHAKLNGASECLGVDIDAGIVQAATMAASAFEVDVNFRQQNLDDSSQWENELNGYDIVSALSVLHWVENKERVWSFLGRHREIIYEGHESNVEAEDNLRKNGFVKIVRLGQSERGRQMFYANKN